LTPYAKNCSTKYRFVCLLSESRRAISVNNVILVSIESQEGDTLKIRTHARLRDAIIFGEFKAGQKLKERELCLLTGASRSVVREAMVRLERDGLVQSRSYSGFSVVNLNVRSITEIFELRFAVETFAAQLFIERASNQEMVALQDAMQSIEKNFSGNNFKVIWAAKKQYYDVLFEGCRNEEIRRSLLNVTDKVLLMRNQLLSDADRRISSINEMRALTTAIVERDPRKVRFASQAHILSARDSLLDHLVEE
jgi:DNA-binding GntR family transcriptional regulator